MKNIFFSSLYIILFCACSVKVIPTEQIKDMQALEQNALAYLPDSKQSEKNNTPHTLSTLKKDYLQKYFSPWHESPNPNKEEVFWIIPSLLKTPGFGEHLQANPLSYTKQILESMQVDNYPNTNQKAIITTTTAVRAVPTLKPMFKKPDGYPFDRWQNSLIFAGTPVLITHTSTDRQWVHIQSSFVYGWVQVKHLATLKAKQIQEIESHKHYVTPTLDKLILIDTHGDFASEARLGQIFAIQEKQKNKPLKLISYARTPDGKATKQILTPLNSSLESAFSEFPLALEPLHIAQSINALLGQRYGWGGFLENRDCSAFIRDIFTQYAIHLPRNSKAQVFYGNNSIDLKNFNRKEKEAFIIANATPYQTILWLNGHIMLYIGELEGKALVAHSAWSVITGKRFENLLTGVVITSLHVGEEKNNIFAHSDLLIDRINAMSDLATLAQKIQEEQ